MIKYLQNLPSAFNCFARGLTLIRKTLILQSDHCRKPHGAITLYSSEPNWFDSLHSVLAFHFALTSVLVFILFLYLPICVNLICKGEFYLWYPRYALALYPYPPVCCCWSLCCCSLACSECFLFVHAVCRSVHFQNIWSKATVKARASKWPPIWVLRWRGDGRNSGVVVKVGASHQPAVCGVQVPLIHTAGGWCYESRLVVSRLAAFVCEDGVLFHLWSIAHKLKERIGEGKAVNVLQNPFFPWQLTSSL